jgi:phosphate transport system substrate-binding protein
MDNMKNIILTLCICILCACNNQQESQNNQESPLRGNETILCDEAVFAPFSKAKPVYDSAFPQAKVILKPVSARAATIDFFAEKSRCMLLARNLMHDEDSILKAFGKTVEKIVLAQDGLVFFTHAENPLDTINLDQLKDIFSGRTKGFSSLFPQLKHEPTLFIPGTQSSEYANLLYYFSKSDAPLSKPAQFIENRDSLRAKVLQANGIGVGYLSYLQKDPAIKLLRIAFTDSTGKRIPPQIVHQGYILQKKYPLAVPVQIFLREKRQNLPWGFSTYMEKEPRVQKILLDAGIIPAYARYNLIQQEAE